MAAVAHADEAGQLALGQRGVVHEAGGDVGAQAVLVVARQEVARAVPGRLVHDEVERGAAQQRGGRCHVGIGERTDDGSDGRGTGHIDKIACAGAPGSGTIAAPVPIPPMTFDRPHLAIFLLALPLLAGRATAAERPQRPTPAAALPAPPNCGLTAPPPDAGIDSSMGQLVKVYPRNPDIGPAYGGCQTLWAEDDGGWSAITVAHYAAGHVAWIESPQEAHDPMAECRVEAGQLVRGDPALCAQLDEIRFESLPAGCLRALQAASASAPRDCERR